MRFGVRNFLTAASMLYSVAVQALEDPNYLQMRSDVSVIEDFENRARGGHVQPDTFINGAAFGTRLGKRGGRVTTTWNYWNVIYGGLPFVEFPTLRTNFLVSIGRANHPRTIPGPSQWPSIPRFAA